MSWDFLARWQLDFFIKYFGNHTSQKLAAILGLPSKVVLVNVCLDGAAVPVIIGN